MGQGILQIAIFCALVVAVTPLLGGYMARVFRSEATLLDPVLGPVERLTYRALRVDPAQGQDADGCKPFAANAFKGGVALLELAKACNVGDQIEAAVNAGAEGVIVFNNQVGDPTGALRSA